MTEPIASAPLLLNLGCGAPGLESWHPLPGCLNLDRRLSNGAAWRFEDGLPQFDTNTVDGITISHALSCLEEVYWPPFLRDCRRVLKVGAVLRITDGNTEHPQSVNYRRLWRGTDNACTYTGPVMAWMYLEKAGLRPYTVTARRTRSRFPVLKQSFHAGKPHCFWIEGVKP